MDVLSSQAHVAGYKAYCSRDGDGPSVAMLVTAGWDSAAARVLVPAPGRGLQAIATARRLGAIVSAFDVRPAVKEQVQSLGANFLRWRSKSTAERRAATQGAVARRIARSSRSSPERKDAAS